MIMIITVLIKLLYMLRIHMEQMIHMIHVLKKREENCLKNLKDPKIFIGYSKNIQDVYNDIQEHKRSRKSNALIDFDDVIPDMSSNKKLNAIVTERFIRVRKLNISTVFLTQSYFQVSKNVRLNLTHFVIMKIPNKRELQHHPSDSHSSDIGFEDFMNLYKKCTAKPYSFFLLILLLHQIRFKVQSFRKNV